MRHRRRYPGIDGVPEPTPVIVSSNSNSGRALLKKRLRRIYSKRPREGPLDGLSLESRIKIRQPINGSRRGNVPYSNSMKMAACQTGRLMHH